MFCTEAIDIKAKRPHKCTWCGQVIEIGETYKSWKSIDDSWFHNKMHFECRDAVSDECDYYGDNEYMPYDNVRPALK